MKTPPSSDWMELGLIAGATAGAWVFRDGLFRVASVGEAVLAGSAVLLAQGLVRDLARKYGPWRKPASCAIAPPDADGKPSARCMCAESTVGTLGLVVGVVALLLGGVASPFAAPAWFWAALVPGVALFGFAIKSVVIDWKQRRLRLVSDHSTIRWG